MKVRKRVIGRVFVPLCGKNGVEYVIGLLVNKNFARLYFIIFKENENDFVGRIVDGFRNSLNDKKISAMAVCR